MKIRLITILIVVLVILSAFLIGTGIASAKNDKPPVPHHNEENQPDKEVPANCHSRHGREAGTDCGTENSESGSSAVIVQLPQEVLEPRLNPLTALKLVLKLTSGGGGGTVHLVY